MATPRANMIKLTQAINYGHGCHVVVNTKMFHGREGRVVKLYNIADSYIDDGKFTSDPLYQSSSVFYSVIFLRNLLYALEGRAIPDDNEGFRKTKGFSQSWDSISFMLSKYKPQVLEDFNACRQNLNY